MKAVFIGMKIYYRKYKVGTKRSYTDPWDETSKDLYHRKIRKEGWSMQ